VDSGRLPRPLPQPTGHPLRGHRPTVRTASPGGRRSASTSDTLAGSAGGGGSRGCALDGRRPAAAVSPPCSGGCGPSAVDSGRPDSTRLHAQPHRGPCRGVRLRGHLLGSALGPRSRRTATVRTLGRWTRLVDSGSRRRPARRTPATAASVVQPLRQRHAGQPAAQPSTVTPMSDQERDRRVRQRPAPPWPDRQIRSLSAVGNLASSWKGSAAQESRPSR
jgi:hypothetical protein